QARNHFHLWRSRTSDSLEIAEFCITKGKKREAAFNFHQAVERAYACFLLVHTFYFPRSHNIKFLRSLAEDVDKRLVEAWPREARSDRRRFELLKRAYVEARYSDQYDPSLEDLEWLSAAAKRLGDRVAALCEERIEEHRSGTAKGCPQDGASHPFRPSVLAARATSNGLA